MVLNIVVGIWYELVGYELCMVRSALLPTRRAPESDSEECCQQYISLS